MWRMFMQADTAKQLRQKKKKKRGTFCGCKSKLYVKGENGVYEADGRVVK